MKEFLERSGLFADFSKAEEYVKLFDAEMKRGLDVAGSSLDMLPTYLDTGRVNGRLQGNVIVIDAGGTNLRVALVNFPAEGAPTISHYNKYPIPGFREEISVETFFERIADKLRNVAELSDKIGFCFSYPAEILPSLDGKIIAFNKEVDVIGAEGAFIASSLRLAMKKSGIAGDYDIVILNDTVATMLAAMADSENSSRFGGFVGLIFGTGLNACYTERNLNIVKSPILVNSPGITIVNAESGGYSGFPLGVPDRALIANTIDKDRQWFEKISSGAYQNSNLLGWLRFAAAEGQFSPVFAERVSALPEIPLGEPDSFLTEAKGGLTLRALCDGDEDQKNLNILISSFFDRIGLYLSVMLTAMVARTASASPIKELPYCISAEGSTFKNEHYVRTRIDEYLNGLLVKNRGLSYEFAVIEDATIMGSAVAGLMGNG